MFQYRAVLLESGDIAAGIAVASGRGFRFFAADPRFARLDGIQFPSVAAALRAVKQAARAPAPGAA